MSEMIDGGRFMNFLAVNAFVDTEVVHATFSSCDFTTAILDGAVFHRVTFAACDFRAADAHGARFTNCVFEDCDGVANLLEEAEFTTRIETKDETELVA